jgi:hypothetical protein
MTPPAPLTTVPGTSRREAQYSLHTWVKGKTSFLHSSLKFDSSSIKNIQRMCVSARAMPKPGAHIGCDNQESLQQHSNRTLRQTYTALGQSSPSEAKAPQYKRVINGLSLMSP